MDGARVLVLVPAGQAADDEDVGIEAFTGGVAGGKGRDGAEEVGVVEDLRVVVPVTEGVGSGEGGEAVVRVWGIQERFDERGEVARFRFHEEVAAGTEVGVQLGREEARTRVDVDEEAAMVGGEGWGQIGDDVV